MHVRIGCENSRERRVQLVRADMTRRERERTHGGRAPGLRRLRRKGLQGVRGRHWQVSFDERGRSRRRRRHRRERLCRQRLLNARTHRYDTHSKRYI